MHRSQRGSRDTQTELNRAWTRVARHARLHGRDDNVTSVRSGPAHVYLTCNTINDLVYILLLLSVQFYLNDKMYILGNFVTTHFRFYDRICLRRIRDNIVTSTTLFPFIVRHREVIHHCNTRGHRVSLRVPLRLCLPVVDFSRFLAALLIYVSDLMCYLFIYLFLH